ncbi:MAG TPA: TonB-dependent receptor, partial [Cytophagaceae bacterium]
KIINPDINPFEIKTAIDNTVAKSNLEYSLGSANKLGAGIEANLYQITPGTLSPLANSNITPMAVDREKGLETGIHLMHDWQIMPIIAVAYGTRLSIYNKLGPGETYSYKIGFPLDEKTITDTIFYRNNQTQKMYSGFEPRATLRLRLSERNSFKINYNRMRQYLQLVTNTASSVPIDRWKLSDGYVKPQIADQYAVGYFRNSSSNQWEMSWEVYYKDIKNVTDYKGGSEHC